MSQVLQTTFKINQNAYAPMSVKPAGKEKPTSEQSSVSGKQLRERQNVLLGSLGGLAVLGTAVYVVKSRMNKKAAQKASEAGANIMEVIRLKHKIKTDFNERRLPLVQRLREKVAEMGNEIEFETIGELSAKIDKLDAENIARRDSLMKHRTEQRQILRNKILKLEQDPEWKELRQTRKRLIKLINGKASPEQKNIAADKVVIVNDLMINKAYPEEIEIFEKLYKMNSEQAFNIVRTKFNTFEDYNKALAEPQTARFDTVLPIRNRNFTHARPLHLTDIFPDEALACIECDKQLGNIDLKTEGIRAIIKQYHTDCAAIAEEFRNSIDTKALKGELAKNHN